jgi:Secretory lipase
MGAGCRRAGGLAAVASLVLLAACSGGRTDGGSSNSSVPPTTAPERPPEAFYAVPDPLPPGPPGALIRATPIAGPSVLPDSRAWAILYHSRDFDGRDVAVSGVVVAPPGAAPPGARPVVVWGHGSAGLADRCAPSRGGVMGTFGRDPLGGLLQQGDVVAATDYQGLGTPGLARAVIGLSAGHAVLDVARAARGLDGAGASGRVVLDGHSEGGHAVLWAAELAGAYAPELQVLGVATSAPGAELAATLKTATDRPTTVTSGAMYIVVAWSDAYRLPLDVLTPAGRRAVDRVRTTCLEELAKDPEHVAVHPADLLTTPPWPVLLARNTPGHAATPAPILLAQGADDDRVTPAATRALVRRLCRRGDTVELRSYQHTGHFDIPKVAANDVAAWMGERLAGRSARSTCER